MDSDNESSLERSRSILGLVAAVALMCLGWMSRKTHVENGKRNNNASLQNIESRHQTLSSPQISCSLTLPRTPRWKTALEILTFVAALGAAGAAGVYAWITNQMWVEMQRQTKIQTEAFIASERPWIKIADVETRGNGQVIPALSFQDVMGAGKRDQQVTFQLKVTVRNVGHSVAEVTVRPDIFLAPWSTGSFFDAVTKEQNDFCQSDLGKARSGYYPSFIVFPDESFDWYGAGAQIVKSSEMSTLSETGTAKFIVPVAIVCVDYRLKSIPSDYQTSAVYEVFRKDNRTRFFEPGIGVSADHIFLVRDTVLDRAN